MDMEKSSPQFAVARMRLLVRQAPWFSEMSFLGPRCSTFSTSVPVNLEASTGWSTRMRWQGTPPESVSSHEFLDQHGRVR